MRVAKKRDPKKKATPMRRYVCSNKLNSVPKYRAKIAMVANTHANTTKASTPFCFSVNILVI
jgi:Holliday junction resolvase RusA-like endonuclease